MRKLFNEYGGWVVIVFVTVVLLLLVGGIKSIDDNGEVKGTGLISIVGNIFSDTIEKNNNHLRYLNGECGPNGEPLVSTTESQVGKYADVDGDGVVDGIIFADLLADSKEKTWGSDKTSYKISKIETSKNYYVSNEKYSDSINGSQDVIVPIGSGTERFYILSLKNEGPYFWYYTASKQSTLYNNNYTSEEFGTGYNNTKEMIKIWNEEKLGRKNNEDMWKKAESKIADGWFIPSAKEYVAIADNLNITKDNYNTKGFSNRTLWTSSICSNSYESTFSIFFDYQYLGHCGGDNKIDTRFCKII